MEFSEKMLGEDTYVQKKSRLKLTVNLAFWLLFALVALREESSTEQRKVTQDAASRLLMVRIGHGNHPIVRHLFVFRVTHRVSCSRHIASL